MDFNSGYVKGNKPLFNNFQLGGERHSVIHQYRLQITFTDNRFQKKSGKKVFLS